MRESCSNNIDSAGLPITSRESNGACRSRPAQELACRRGTCTRVHLMSRARLQWGLSQGVGMLAGSCGRSTTGRRPAAWPGAGVLRLVAPRRPGPLTWLGLVLARAWVSTRIPRARGWVGAEARGRGPKRQDGRGQPAQAAPRQRAGAPSRARRALRNRPGQRFQVRGHSVRAPAASASKRADSESCAAATSDTPGHSTFCCKARISAPQARPRTGVTH
jgi:hypothetical protein